MESTQIMTCVFWSASVVREILLTIFFFFGLLFMAANLCRARDLFVRARVSFPAEENFLMNELQLQLQLLPFFDSLASRISKTPFFLLRSDPN